MLDKRTETMLSVANTLTAEDLDRIRTTAPAPTAKLESPNPAVEKVPGAVAEELPEAQSAPDQDTISTDAPASAGMPQGERERLRTRESKISTACVGQERPKHEWWPVGTELVGRMGAETFTALVIENRRVKSGRSIRITSGAAAGKVCKTPTRAAIEATEAYRQAHHYGRGGGVTNGWTFWKPGT